MYLVVIFLYKRIYFRVRVYLPENKNKNYIPTLLNEEFYKSKTRIAKI